MNPFRALAAVEDDERADAEEDEMDEGQRLLEQPVSERRKGKGRAWLGLGVARACLCACAPAWR